MALEQEYEAFKRELPDLLRSMKGKFVLVHGGAVEGSWDDEEAANMAGCRKFVGDPFLVMPVVEQEEPVRLFQVVAGFHAHPTRPT